MVIEALENYCEQNNLLMGRGVSLADFWMLHMFSDFIWDFGKLPFPTHLGKYFIKIGKNKS